MKPYTINPNQKKVSACGCSAATQPATCLINAQFRV
jgi:hypothetical protein